ncbi:MAG: ASKHA domain-containing protein, partial [Lachnospiraceae bacterium]|nr:ASKHA domain-containing protein [Lachnospiraceae bacterium]
MSENISVTVLRENHTEISIMHDTDVTLMSTLLKENLISGAFCGGRGSCGRCRIQFISGVPIPSVSDRSTFTPDELRKGYRLACMARPKQDCVVSLDLIGLDNTPQQIDILTMTQHIVVNDGAVRNCHIKSKNDNYDAEANNAYEDTNNSKDSINNPKDKTYMIAVDLGTTTIGMQLMEMNSGKVADTYCAMNPQRSYGADVLSRIQAANSGHEQNLRDSVWKVLQAGVDRFRDIGEICCMCIAGNTVMEHLLMGLSTGNLGRSPFTPVEIGLQKCTLPYNKNDGLSLQVYITPGISAFVGGDIVAGLYHCGLLDALQSEQKYEKGDAVLFIDLGTNGEMAITDGNRMIVTAASAGPAFEGGANAEAPGSDMIAVTASLLRQGIIDETGLLEEDSFEQGIDVPILDVNGLGEKVIHLTQKDIRDIQMAKAAVRAGIEILYEKMGQPKITHVYLAGGFGYYLDVNAAIDIGLLPENMRHIVTAAGNTSLAGAYEMGRDLWTGRLKEENLTDALNVIESLNLAEQENFEALY